MNTSWCAVNFAILFFVYCVSSQKPCTTPNGEPAQCISVYNCKSFIQALNHQRTPEVISFVKASTCGYMEDPLVCCGSVAKYQSFTTQTPFTSSATTPSVPVTQHRNKDLLPSNCGRQSIQNKVLGGKETGSDEFPWMALLEYRKNGKSVGHSCGGVLINDRYILTAAHCIIGQVTTAVGDVFRVRLGEYDRRTDTDCVPESGCNEPHQDIEIEEAIAHPGYVPNLQGLSSNDIGLLRLKNKPIFNDFVGYICLPLQGERSNAGENLTVAGWGKTEKGYSSPIKLKAYLPVVSDNQCKSIYLSRANVQVTDSQFCAGGEQGIDSCDGDSGGPLMRNFPGRELFYVEGIVSFGLTNCGKQGFPGIYTRVSDYLHWILDNVKP